MGRPGHQVVFEVIFGSEGWFQVSTTFSFFYIGGKWILCSSEDVWFLARHEDQVVCVVVLSGCAKTVVGSRVVKCWFWLILYVLANHSTKSSANIISE